MEDETKIVPFGVIKGRDEMDKPDGLPFKPYIIEDIDGKEYAAEGFLIFTSHHIAVMQDAGAGAIPVLVMPLNRVRVAELFDEEEVFED